MLISLVYKFKRHSRDLSKEKYVMFVNERISLAFFNKLMYKMNAFLIKIAVELFVIKRLMVIFKKKTKEPEITRVILKKEGREASLGEISLWMCCAG